MDVKCKMPGDIVLEVEWVESHMCRQTTYLVLHSSLIVLISTILRRTYMLHITSFMFVHGCLHSIYRLIQVFWLLCVQHIWQ